MEKTIAKKVISEAAPSCGIWWPDKMMHSGGMQHEGVPRHFLWAQHRPSPPQRPSLLASRSKQRGIMERLPSTWAWRVTWRLSRSLLSFRITHACSRLILKFAGSRNRWNRLTI
eukprot:5997910-Pyramimonas_sp.AAC.1